MKVETAKRYGPAERREREKNLALEIGARQKQLELRPCLTLAGRAEQAHLAAIVESCDDAIISKTLDGTVQSWNKSAERILGYPAHEMIGRSIRELIPTDRQDEEMKIIRYLQETGQRVEHFRTVRLTRDGSRLDVVVSISPIRDENGNIVGASKILRSLTEQRQAVPLINDSDARLRAVVDSALDGIITLTELGVIESINEAGIATFGYSREEVIGQHIRMLIPDASFSAHDESLANVRLRGVLQTGGSEREVVGRRKDGREFPVDLAVREVQLNSCKLFTAVVRDITPLNDAARALREAKEAAEAANRAREHILSVLSHELRMPLTPALAEMSFMAQDPSLSVELRERLKMICRNLETEARLVDDLLDMNRITQGKVNLRIEIVDLHDVLRAALGMFQAAIDARSLEINTSLHAKQHHIWADPGRMQQILLNLLSNAVKFTPANGRISIRSYNVPDGMIEIEVRDSGVGIDPEILPRIFDSFEQEERTRQLGGLGLGLSIARSLTELHLGKLTASSDGRDLGSVFRLSLAAAAPPHAYIPPVAQSVNAFKSKHRILVVEEHDDTRAVLGRLLKSLGHQVTLAANVRAALEAGEGGSFDLLICDIGLPDGNGLDVMRRLKGRVERGIALSGFGQEDDLRRSYEAGFDEHITKPVNFDLLKEVLERVFKSTF